MQEKTVGRIKEIERVDRQLRRARDVLVISPPFSGLTTFLRQVGRYVEAAEQFDHFQILYLDCQEIMNNGRLTLEQFCRVIIQQLKLNSATVTGATEEKRLAEFLESILAANTGLRLVLTLDNLDILPDDDILSLLQQIRVVSESRSSKRFLQHVLFVVGAHCLDLRKYDPKHVSPFNVAEKIILEDLAEHEALELINSLIEQHNKTVSSLEAKYICYTTGNHPFLIHELCSHLLHGVIPGNGTYSRLDFNSIDRVIEAICEEGEDSLLRQLSKLVAELPTSTLECLLSILNGARYDSSKKTHFLKELALLGIITESKGPIWQIRNPIFDLYLRRIPRLQPVLDFKWILPRRLFANIEGYQILFQLENDLRDFILAKLYSKFGEQWWARVDEKVALYCQGLKTKELESGWFPSEDLPSLAYAHLPHLKKIINDNWSSIFHEYFKPQSIFTGVFEALEGIRNRIAHNRPLTDHEIDQLKHYARLFHNCMYDKTPNDLNSIRIRKHSSGTQGQKS